MTHITRISEFFVEGKNQKKSHVLLHITEPTTVEEWKRGYFFALCEIEEGSLELIEYGQRLIDDIESGYYESDSDDSEKSSFERTLEFINRRSTHVLQDTGKLHCIVGVIKDTTISFSYHGNPLAQVFFLQDDAIHNMDILSSGEEKEDSEHLFSAVIEGNINKHDRLFIGTPHITNELTINRLQEIIMSRPIQEAVEHIEHVLKDARTDESFGGIICDIVKKDVETTISRSNSAASLQHLIDRERETTETLSPPLFGGNKKKAQQKQKRQHTRRNAIETNHRRSKHDIIGSSFINVLLVSIGKGIVGVSSFFWKMMKFIVITCFHFFVVIFTLITNKNNGRSHTLRSIQESVRSVIRSITGLSFLSKILLLSMILLAAIFAGSVTFLRIEEQTKQQILFYTTQIQAIEDKKLAADARQIYNDEAGAFALLKEAETLIQALPQESDEQLEAYNRLRSLVDTALLDLRNITLVTPTVVANLETLDTNVQATNLLRIDDLLVAYGPEDNKLYMIDKDTGAGEPQSYDSLATLFAGNTPKENDMILFFGANNSVFVYDPETKALTNTDITFPNETTEITAPFIYNLRLYHVDKANNQILRHSKTQGGYDRGTSWLDDTVSVDLHDAISTAIDGDVFVLKENGEIFKFVAGEQISFDITGLDPPLEHPTELYTYNDVDGIYILEPTQQRVVVLNKQGTFRAQYTSDLWQNPTGMVVDEVKKTIYVLDSNKIYSFNF